MFRNWMTPFALALTVGLGAASCAGKAPVPDEQTKREYRSTEEEETAATPDGQGEMTPVQQSEGEAVRATGPVATVDGESIGADEFNLEIQRVVASGMPPAMLGQFKDQIVEKLVDRHLIENAIKKQNVAVSEEELDQKMEEVREEFSKASQQMGNEASLEAITQQLGITEKELRDSIEQSIAIEKILMDRGMEEPDEATVKAFYEANKEQFERPEQVHARHILVQVDRESDQAAWDAAEKKAQMLRKEATATDSDFAKLAEEKSEGPSASKGGDLGFFGRGQMVPAFEEAVFSLQKGEVSEPVKTDFGWHIIKLEEKREAGTVPFEEIDDELAAQMKNQAIQEALVAYLDELRGSANIELHPQNIN